MDSLEVGLGACDFSEHSPYFKPVEKIGGNETGVRRRHETDVPSRIDVPDYWVSSVRLLFSVKV